MLPIGFLITLLAWVVLGMSAVGLFFWAARWFPQQRWFAPSLVALFLLLMLLARTTKWALPVLALLLLFGSAFIPRKR